MKHIFSHIVAGLCVFFFIACSPAGQISKTKKTSAKPSPEQALAILKDGNDRFVRQRSIHPNTTMDRLIQAGKENQADHAFATVLACSDSRVPVERIFDAGIMDLFVVRVAGNVCDVDEIGSIEYGLAHVRTPVLVVLGHTQCGAVTAVANSLHGEKHALERNIPRLIDNIAPAVERAAHQHPGVGVETLIPFAIEENVWQAMEDLFLASPTARALVQKGDAKVIGAIYDVGAGKINWLPESKVTALLNRVEQNPARAVDPMASE